MSCVRPLSTFRAPPVVLTKMTSVDGVGFLLFFRQLSQLYQGLGPIDPPPHHEPEAIRFAEPLKVPSPPYDRFDLSAQLPRERPEWRAPESVAFRLTDAQLTEIRDFVTKGIKHPKVTRVDTVVGLLARCLSEVEPESKPIDTISYLINVRPFPPSPVPYLIFHSTEEWVYTRPTQRSMRPFTSP